LEGILRKLKIMAKLWNKKKKIFSLNKKRCEKKENPENIWII